MIREGHILEGVQFMKDSVDLSKLTRPERIGLFRKLSQTYAEHKRLLLLEKDGNGNFLNPDGQADFWFKELLKFDKEHEVDTSLTTDPAELIYLYQSFRTWPIMHISVFGGASLTQVNIDKIYSLGLINEETEKKALKERIGANFGFQIDIPVHAIHDNIRIGTGLNYTNRVYGYDGPLFSFQSESNSPGSFANLSFEENQNWLGIPLIFSYHHDRDLNLFNKGARKNGRRNYYNFRSLKNLIVPYAYVGISYHHLLDASIQSIRRQNEGIPSLSGFSRASQGNLIEVNSISNPGNGPVSMRNKHNYALMLGGGLKLKTELHYLFLGIQFLSQRQLVNEPVHRYAHQELTYTFGHVDNDFRLNSFSISAGFSYTVYRPKKRKNRSR